MDGFNRKTRRAGAATYRRKVCASCKHARVQTLTLTADQEHGGTTIPKGTVIGWRCHRCKAFTLAKRRHAA
jgi:hypothetical protein